MTDKYSILARYFFDLANKIDELAESEIAQSVDTFDEEDYGSLVASHLDAAYWILSGTLDPDTLEGGHGVSFYVSSSVYNDLLYRGYTPEWAWDESGLGNLFDVPVIEDEAGAEEPSEKVASGVGPGDYVTWRTDAGVRAGLVYAPGKVFAFDGARETLPSDFERISRPDAYAAVEKHSKSIVASWQARNGVSG